MQTSNIASLKRTDQPAPERWVRSVSDLFFSTSDDVKTALAGLVATINLLVVWISLRPFSLSTLNTEGVAQPGGDLVNQIGFALIGGLSLTALAALAPRHVVSRLFRPAHVLAAIVLVTSAIIAQSTGAAMRALIFSLIVVLGAATVMALPRSQDHLLRLLSRAVMLAVLFSLFAVFVLPEQGVHQAGSVESQHAGLWRGVYDHKNIASAVMAVFAFAGLYLWRSEHRFLGATIILLSMMFITFSGSKTVLILLPAIVLFCTFARYSRSQVAKYFWCLVPPIALFTFTAGAAISKQINEYVQWVSPGTTYTGRLDLWQFSVDRILERPLFGYGFESFWGTPLVKSIEQPIELSWDVRDIVHAHNGYLDAAISFGLIGLAVLLLVLIVLPVRDYVKTRQPAAQSHLSDFLLMVWMFCAMDACLESFFLRRADPVWFSMLLAIFGLRLLCALQGAQNQDAKNQRAFGKGGNSA
ncbi:MAG: O-antigen ligase [Pseudomonadota bacterium]